MEWRCRIGGQRMTGGSDATSEGRGQRLFDRGAGSAKWRKHHSFGHTV